MQNLRIIALLAIYSLGFIGSPALAEGYWQFKSHIDDDGDRICVVETEMSGGSEVSLFAIAARKDIHMIFHNPKWRMDTGETYDVKVSIDGHIYKGQVNVLKRDVLAFVNLEVDFIKAFIDGNQMIAYLGKERWTMNLLGSDTATKALVRCILQSGGSESNPFR
jgi:hypothetical protein